MDGRKRKQYFDEEGNLQIPAKTGYRILNRYTKKTHDMKSRQSLLNSEPPLLYSGRIDFVRTDDCSDSKSSGFSVPKYDEPEFRERNLLYPGSKISQDEAKLLIIGFATKRSLSREATTELLDVINFFLPDGEGISNSVYFLKKEVRSFTSISETHHYCKNCKNYIMKNVKSPPQNLCSCPNPSVGYFLTFDLKYQIENLLKNEAAAVKVLQTLGIRGTPQLSEHLTDIYDGKLYKKLELTGYDLSCTFNTDGVPAFKSSKVAIWPILISLNEIPYNMRYRSVIIAGIVVGKKKPDFSMFFPPFVTMCQALSSTNHVKWIANGERVTSNIYFPLCVADTIARCMCQGTIQFNGSYGCTWCLAPGESYFDEAGKRRWVYKPKKNYELRSKEQFLDQLKEYSTRMENGIKENSHFGIKEASPLLLLPKFDIIHGLVFDCMHTVYLGVAKAFTKLWFNPNYHCHNFYLGKKRNHINKRLTKISVPGYFSRCVRSTNELAFWKASEWRTWTFIVPVVLEGILPLPYLRHFSKFVKAIMLLSSRSVTAESISVSEKNLIEFTEGIPVFYGTQFCSFNAHALTHAAKCVENWGPLFAYSAFQFENYNGILLNMFNGASNIAKQIANRVDLLLSTTELSCQVRSSDATNYFESLLHGTHRWKSGVLLDSVLLFGKCKQRYLNSSQKKLLLEDGVSCKTIKTYRWCRVNSTNYGTTTKSATKRCDSIIELNGEAFQVLCIFAVSSTAYCFAKRINHRLQEHSVYKVISVSKKAVLLKLENVMSKYIIMYNEKSHDISFLVKIPNSIETE